MSGNFLGENSNGKSLFKWGRSVPADGLDWRVLIAGSELSTSIQRTLTAVVVKSRLWRQEKNLIASELIAHFEDGLARGNSEAELLADFGDPLVAAKLIRASKLRNRTMKSKLLSGGIWGALALGLGYVGLAALFYFSSPNPNVDYLADLNRRALTVSAEDSAWQIYRDAFKKYNYSEGGNNKFDELFIKSEPDQTLTRLVRATDGAAWKIAVKKLEESAGLLEAFRKARTKSHLGLLLQSDPRDYAPEDFAALYPQRKSVDDVSLPISEDATNRLPKGSLINILLPHYQPFRTSARILTVDSRWAVEQQDLERATQNIEAIFAIARQIGNDPVLVGDLIAFAIHSIGYDLIDELLSKHSGEFSEQQLERIQQAVACDSLAAFLDLAGERATALDIIQRAFTDDGQGDGRVTSQGMALLQNISNLSQNQQAELGVQDRLQKTWEYASAPLALMTMSTRKQVVANYESNLERAELAFDKPYYEQAEYDLELQADLDPFLNQLFISINQIRHSLNRAIGNQNGTLAAIAVYRYQQKHGKLPKSLDQVVGEFLDEVPLDQCNGQPLHYRKTEKGFVIYSVGLDGVDGGGADIMVPHGNTDSTGGEIKLQPQRANRFIFTEKNQVGDWILWPRRSELED